MVIPVGVLSMGQIDLFKDYSYSVGYVQKKSLKKQLHKKYKWFPIDTSWYKNNPIQVEIPLKLNNQTGINVSKKFITSWNQVTFLSVYW